MTRTTAKHALIAPREATPAGATPVIWLLALTHALFFMIERQKQRKALLHLDDRLLRDVGITREQAWMSACKWFWQK